MERFGRLKRMHGVKMSKQQSTSGVENFGDDNPVAELMEDLIQEMNDHDALKDGKKNEKQNKEVQLVAGGKALREKCGVQILNGKANPIGGEVVVLSELRVSPTMSETTNNSENGSSKKKTSRNLFFNDSELIENEKKRLSLRERSSLLKWHLSVMK